MNEYDSDFVVPLNKDVLVRVRKSGRGALQRVVVPDGAREGRAATHAELVGNEGEGVHGRTRRAQPPAASARAQEREASARPAHLAHVGKREARIILVRGVFANRVIGQPITRKKGVGANIESSR